MFVAYAHPITHFIYLFGNSNCSLPLLLMEDKGRCQICLVHGPRVGNFKFYPQLIHHVGIDACGVHNEGLITIHLLDPSQMGMRAACLIKYEI